MKDRNDFQLILTNPVRDEVRRARHDELARPSNSSRPAQARLFTKQIHGGQDARGDCLGRVRFVLRDVGAQVFEMLERAPGPDDRHRRGGFRSRRWPHERSQRSTAS